MDLNTPVENLTSVGKTTASRLQRMGITMAKDLLFHFPNRYEDWTQTMNIEKIVPNQNISIEGVVASIKSFKSPRKKLAITEVVVKDQTGSIKVIWFNQAFLVKNLPIGTKLSLSGKAEIKGKEIILKSPKYEVILEGEQKKYTSRILPIYPLSLNLTQKQIQFLIDLVLPLVDELVDPLPAEIKEKMRLPNLADALHWIHRPETMEQVKSAQKRLAFEELFYLQLQATNLRLMNEKLKSTPLKFFQDEIKVFVETLPFKLTDDQKRTAFKIFLDLKENKPMNRLVQGDVGSGKTVVAALAMYNTALNGAQSVLMAPTEVLAGQHFISLSQLFEKIDLPVALFTRTQHKVSNKGEITEVKKKELITLINEGQIALTIGTHALIQPNVNFRRLELAVVDEQHRFGVEQRKALRRHSGNDKKTPHLLSMTATPIPRSLALVFYGDLSISSIRQMPKNRLPIKTKVITESKRKEAYQFIRHHIEQGSQVYVVCPLIEESDKLGVTSVSEESKRLQKVFPQAIIASLHGKLSAQGKEEIMGSFKRGATDILVATTVIEVGVDVSNAVIMLIEGAERFGLSQLHQIRGRVGRGEKQSYCYLMPSDDQAIGRLKQFIRCKDGFEIAELDLRIRGSGEVFGTKQSGVLELRFTDLSDTGFVEQVNGVAVEFLKEHLVDEFPLLKKHIDRLNEKIHLE